MCVIYLRDNPWTLINTPHKPHKYITDIYGEISVDHTRKHEVHLLKRCSLFVINRFQNFSKIPTEANTIESHSIQVSKKSFCDFGDFALFCITDRYIVSVENLPQVK